MREIKFRAYIPPTHWIAENDGDMIDDWFQTVYHESLRLPDESEGIVLMQYTGLQDTNESDIYEGDIIQTNRTIGIKYGFIEYHAPSFKLISFIDGMAHTISDSTKWKIIGNLYQNPEIKEKYEKTSSTTID